MDWAPGGLGRQSHAFSFTLTFGNQLAEYAITPLGCVPKPYCVIKWREGLELGLEYYARNGAKFLSGLWTLFLRTYNLSTEIACNDCHVKLKGVAVGGARGMGSRSPKSRMMSVTA